MNQKLPPSTSRTEVAAMNEQAHAVIARLAARDPHPHERRKTLSCGCLTYRQGPESLEVLLVRPWPNKHTWGVPKGHIHTQNSTVNGLSGVDQPTETPQQCAERETLEETGLKVVCEMELPQTHTQSYDEDKTVRTFLARQVNPTAEAYAADGENAEVRWHPIDWLPPLHAYQVSVIAAALPLIRERLRRPAAA